MACIYSMGWFILSAVFCVILFKDKVLIFTLILFLAWKTIGPYHPLKHRTPKKNHDFWSNDNFVQIFLFGGYLSIKFHDLQTCCR